MGKLPGAAQIFSVALRILSFFFDKGGSFKYCRRSLARRDQSWSLSRLPSTLPIADHVVTRRASVAAPSDGTKKAPASHPVLETPAVAKAPRLASRQKPQARANSVSATVDLFRDKLALIRQHCSAQTAGSAIRFRRRSKTICASLAKLLSGMRTMSRE
jgi:hypothetical protein